MRQFFPLVILLAGGFTFTACSKKADTSPGATSAPGSATTTTAGASSAPAEDPGISFNLSGSGTGGKPVAAQSELTPANANTENAQPRRLNEIYPFYPLSLRMRGIEGRVDVRIHINIEGRVEKAEVVGATEERFSPYALAAVKTARFIPAIENGKPVPYEAIFAVPFMSELGSGSLPPDSVLARLAYLDGLYYMKDATGKMVLAETKEPIRLSIVTAYPATAKPGETLRAKVKVSINDEGQVTSATISEASTPEFATALKDVTQFWHFIPKLKAGKPVTAGFIEFPLVYPVPGAPAN